MAWLAATLFGAGCGRTQLDAPVDPFVDAGLSGRDVSAAADAPPSCELANDAAILISDTGDGWCGGEIALAGVTPLGPFCPTQIQSFVGLGDCGRHLSVTLTDGGGYLARQALSFSLVYDPARRPWNGTYQVMAFLSAGSASRTRPNFFQYPATVEVTASDDPFATDGGTIDTIDPPIGEIHLRFTMPTPTGIVSGTLISRYCRWSICI